jgi:esterase
MGDGPPLVILHGLFGSARNWGRIARDLSADFHVYAVDLPNHGDSPWVDKVDYASMAEALAGFLRIHALTGKAAVLGHSMGGKVAMTLALTSSDAIERLIVVDIAPVAYGHARDNTDIIDALLALPLAELTSRKEADTMLAPRLPDPMLRAYLLTNLTREAERFVWKLNLEGLRRSIDAIHGFPNFGLDVHYDRPSLFIAGEKSAYVRATRRPEIQRLFPAARIETVPGAGHWVHAEAPEAVVALVTDFMRG